MADKKCAPNVEYKDGSCLSISLLKHIAENENKKNPNDKIKISDNKKELVDNLEKKLKSKCSDQLCWLSLVKNSTNDDIKEEINNTIRPLGPKGKHEWLSTTDINDVVSQYEKQFNDFIFLGAVPADFEQLISSQASNINFDDFEKDKKYQIGMVINLDDHTQGGSHWVALYINLKKNQIYYFDSFAKKPSKRTKLFINKIFNFLYNKKYGKKININKLLSDLKSDKNSVKLPSFSVKYNTVQHQFKNSECGVYSLNFIIRLVRGESFDAITKNPTSDDVINSCRGVYFNNNNLTPIKKNIC